MYVHKFNLSDLEDMMPWERDVYISLLNNHIQEQNEKKNRFNG